MAQSSHYDTLGVRRGAPADDVRRAYLERARELHPDRYIDATPAVRATAEQRIRELNEAWRVLGNKGRRLEYDIELDRAAGVRVMVDDDRFLTRHDGTMPEDVEPLDTVTRLVRALPWIAVIVILGGIFIFTAYAISDNGEGTVPASGNCIVVNADTSVTTSTCDLPDARRVVVEVSSAQVCPAGTERLQPINVNHALCLSP